MNSDEPRPVILNAVRLMRRICELEWRDEQDPGAGIGLDRWICEVHNDLQDLAARLGVPIEECRELRPECKYELDCPEDELLRATKRCFRQALKQFHGIEGYRNAHRNFPLHLQQIDAMAKMGWHLPHPEADERPEDVV